MKIIVTLALTLLMSVSVKAKASALNDTTPKIIQACTASTTSGSIKDLCVVYTKGFIEGAKRIDDIFVTHVINEKKVLSDYLNRVYKTRVGEDSAKVELVEKAPFCMTGTENITEIAIHIIKKELNTESLTSINDSIYKYMTQNYVCAD